MATNTKERILDAAERLFADHGFPTTSMRDITNEACVNLAAVNYHFGSKEALLIAVLERTTAPVNRARLERLDELEARGNTTVPTDQVVRAFLTPLFDKWCEWGKSDPKFLKLVGRIHAEVDQELRAKFLKKFDTVFQRFSTAFQRSLPELDAVEVHWRLLFLLGSMAYTMTWAEAIIATDARAEREPEAILESLIQFATAGMAAAPVTEPVGVRAGRRMR
jgi:AcrR family transcriptional regulator|tara:strand:+ start:130 stop:792 length:663 start_codon:yes stop_codon:yes gene_type:complete